LSPKVLSSHQSRYCYWFGVIGSVYART